MSQINEPVSTAADDKLVFDPDMEEIVSAFIMESREGLDNLDKELLALEKSPGNQELVKSVFRRLHTIKGNSRALNLDKLNTLVHRMEDVVRKTRDGQLRLNPAALDVIFKSVDIVKILVSDIADRKKSRIDTEQALAALGSVLENPGAGATPEVKKLEIEDDMKEIVDGFIIESEELLTGLDSNLLELEKDPQNEKSIGAVFRQLHTLKGNSRSLGFTLLEEVSHNTEDLIRAARDGKLKLCAESIDVLLKAADILKLLLNDVKIRVVSSFDTKPLQEEVKLALENDIEALKRLHAKAAAADIGETRKSGQSTLRVDLDKLDKLIRDTGELVLGRNRLLNFLGEFEQNNAAPDMPEKLAEIIAQLNIIVSELQSEARTTRMQPVGKIFSRYPRVVRDLSRDLGREIDLVISGEATELDNTIIEDIGDPLIHLVRNCCDHGIENPEVREAAGKSRRGRIDLGASQEGNSVIIEITDDGKGMDPEMLKAAAVKKGVIDTAKASKMTDADAFNLIFAAGFSTAEKVTAVSGRGVGMDVVKNSIAKLNGIVDVESVKGRGTKIRIKLPLTMAVTTALEIETGRERYLVPQESVIEIMRVPRKAYETVVGEGMFLFRNKFRVPLVDLQKILNATTINRDGLDHGYIIVFGSVEQRTGVLVDNVLQQHEVVVKPLGDFIAEFRPRAITGAAVMGDGNVELILNPGYLISAGAGARKT